MSQTYFAILTAIGEAKLANATALGTTLQLTQMGIGDGNGSTPLPNRSQTALVRENRRAPLNRLFVDPANASQIIAEQVIPEEIGGWWIREIGLYDTDGNLCAVANCPDTYKPVLAEGSGRTQVIRMVLIVSNTAAVQLKIDPAIVLATRGYVDDEFGKHLANLDPHPQYMTAPEVASAISGKADKATTLEGYGIALPSKLEAELGEDEVKPMTPLRVMQAISSRLQQATEGLLGLVKFATQAEVDSGTVDQKAISPKGLRWGFSISKNQNGYVVLPTWLGGLIIQWGRTGSVNQGATAVINFPLAFPNTLGTLQLCPYTAHISSASVASIVSHTLSTATVVNGDTDTAYPYIFWFAIGY
jgi:hypothetical protein